MQRTLDKAICALLTCAWAGIASAQMEDEDLALVYDDKPFITIATGSRIPVTRAPAVATVITAEDIQTIGAVDLDQVLETVPGLHVARSTQTNFPVYVIRGVHSDTNPQVLMLINGIPMTTVFAGNRGNVWGGMPLENVARIEVIRGPGSALYGADAFSGVINIITKTAADIGHTEVGARVGSFNTADAWTLYGGTVGTVEVASYLRAGKSDGDKQTISADAQTGWDNIYGTNASRAPGPINLGYKAFDGSLDLSYKKLRFRAAYKRRDDVGAAAGVAQALDPTGKNFSDRSTTDFTYQDPNFGKDWDVTLQASYLHYREFSDLTLYPAGAFGGTFPDGMIGNPYKWERHSRLTASAFYTGFANQRLLIGTGVMKEDLYKIQETKNFTFVGLAPAPLGSVVDVSSTGPFLVPHDRIVRYLYAQDEWNFAKDWTFTAGVRHDQYSDFGNTTNPRVALVWDAAYNLTTKLLYGTAFRAPSFNELYNINNPVQIGNPSLTPEKMKTLEAAVSWQPVPKLQLGMNVFHYRMADIIRLVPNSAGFTAENTGEQIGNGMEFEAKWDATKKLHLSGNYAYQRSIDKASNQDSGNAPHHKVYVRSDWHMLPTWTLNTQVNWVADRKRAPGDTRPDIPNYTTVDLNLLTRMIRNQWNFAFTVRNLFNADAREPSPYSTPFVSVPNDFPLPGRTFQVQASYQL